MQIMAFFLLLIGLLLGLPACDRKQPIDWNRKDAHRNCSAAIAAYPEKPAPPCQAMHMCMNEAKLTPEEIDKLLAMIRSTPGCREP
jgi:hypothetical protein